MEMHSNSGYLHRFALQKQKNDMNVQLVAGEILLRSVFFIPSLQFARRFLKKIKIFDIIYTEVEEKTEYGSFPPSDFIEKKEFIYYGIFNFSKSKDSLDSQASGARRFSANSERGMDGGQQGAWPVWLAAVFIPCSER